MDAQNIDSYGLAIEAKVKYYLPQCLVKIITKF
jgi:hypothetical protein